MAPPNRGGHGRQGHLWRSREHGRRDAVAQGGVERSPSGAGRPRDRDTPSEVRQLRAEAQVVGGAGAGDRRLSEEVAAQALLHLQLHPCVSEAASDEADGVERAQPEWVFLESFAEGPWTQCRRVGEATGMGRELCGEDPCVVAGTRRASAGRRDAFHAAEAAHRAPAAHGAVHPAHVAL